MIFAPPQGFIATGLSLGSGAASRILTTDASGNVQAVTTVAPALTWSANQTFSAQVILKDGIATSPSAVFTSALTTGLFSRGGGANVSIANSGTQYFEFGANFFALVGASNTVIWQDVAGGATKLALKKTADAVLSLENDTVAQEFRVSGTTTGPKYGFIKHNQTHLVIGTDATGSDSIVFHPRNTLRWTMDGGDGAWIGASGSDIRITAANVVADTTTGVKFGTAANQKLGWWNATPVVQGAAIADASGGAVIDAEARAAINTLLARNRTYGLIAT